jgi:hypothetical protein
LYLCVCVCPGASVCSCHCTGLMSVPVCLLNIVFVVVVYFVQCHLIGCICLFNTVFAYCPCLFVCLSCVCVLEGVHVCALTTRSSERPKALQLSSEQNIFLHGCRDICSRFNTRSNVQTQTPQTGSEQEQTQRLLRYLNA